MQTIFEDSDKMSYKLIANPCFMSIDTVRGHILLNPALKKISATTQYEIIIYFFLEKTIKICRENFIQSQLPKHSY